MKALLLQAAALPALAVMASAQVPVGPEFQVNTETYFAQGVRGRAVAVAPNGDFVVVWQSALQPSLPGRVDVRGQRFAASGARLGAEFVVSGPFDNFSTIPEPRPSVAVDGAGNFVVVWWREAAGPGDPWGILARRYDATGTPRGPEFQVNTNTHINGQQEPTVASDAAGNFVVVWTTKYDQDGDGWGIGGRRYDAAGNPVGGQFVVNSYTTGSQARPSIDMDAAGNSVVVWSEWGGTGLFGRRFDPAGVPQGLEFPVNAYTLSPAMVWPVVAADGGGNFVVVWTRTLGSVVARRFDASGAPQGGEFQVNTVAVPGYIYEPSVDAQAGGDFTVAWTRTDGDNEGVFARRMDPAGVPRGPEFQVNTYTTYRQDSPAVAAGPAGTFVIVWESWQDGSFEGVFGQRFGGLQPVGLVADPLSGPHADGNGVFEPNEDVIVAPVWRNVSGASQLFSGFASNFTGPGTAGDPVYEILGADAQYGTVADGATATCTNCFILGQRVTNRPAPHWDAAFREDIFPPHFGQSKVWTLHIGNSFSDVPTASGFYPFIETLLHHNVTSGCSADAYCPVSETTREQMAVFVLVAKEGAGYAPPACTTPVFDDVPASDPFCPWIEELFRRGVVNGCGGGNYCPTASVTREEMAVFVLRTLDPALIPPPCTTPLYNDVPPGSGFCPWIEELTRRNVVTGCGGNNYCPSAAVTREQMSVFISATFGLTLYGP